MKKLAGASTFILIIIMAAVLLLPGFFLIFGGGMSLRGHLNPFNRQDRYADVWGEGSYAYIGSYGGTGLMIIDISNPDKPVLAGYYNPARGGRFQDVVVIDGIGYFSSESGGGVHIVDVRNPARPVLLRRISPADGGYPYVHTIFVADQVLYENDFRTSVVKAFDVRNPRRPVLLWDIHTSDTPVHASVVINNRLYTSGWGGITDVFDVRNIRGRAPLHLGSVKTGNHSHSCWATPDGNLLVASCEIRNGSLRLFDISDLKHPRLLSAVSEGSLGISAYSPHNPYLVGNMLFVSWYQAGLIVIDVSNPRAPRFLGQYDTYTTAGIPAVDNPAVVHPSRGETTVLVHDVIGGPYRGCWGVYPFLGMDRILCSDTDKGLFVVDVRGLF
jgi:hypothetical protein